MLNPYRCKGLTDTDDNRWITIINIFRPAACNTKIGPVAVLMMQGSMIYRWNQKNMSKNIFDGSSSKNVLETIAAIFQNSRHSNTIIVITIKLVL